MNHSHSHSIKKKTTIAELHSQDEESTTHEYYDTSLIHENILCVEMINNNKVYIKFKEDSTVKDIIKKIISHKEFERLYHNKDWILDSEDYTFLFDLHLILFRNIKPEKESKVDLDIKLYELKENGLIKSSRHPFFRFLDNRNPGTIAINSNSIGNVIKEYETLKYLNLNMIYTEYLPRVNTKYACLYDDDIPDIYDEHIQRLNSLNQLKIDNLIAEKGDNSNWFNHDDESLNFLMKMETTYFEVDFNNILITKDNQLFFQDKLDEIPVSTKEFRKFLITIFLTEFETKLQINLNTKAIDILNRVNDKLIILDNKELTFIPHLKALKARSTNDYILDLNVEIGYFNYIIQCLKASITPEFIIVDHPDPDRNVGQIPANSISDSSIDVSILDRSGNKLVDEKLKGMFDNVQTHLVQKKNSKRKFTKIKKFLEIAQYVPPIPQLKKHITNEIKESTTELPIQFRERSSFHAKKKNLTANLTTKTDLYRLNETLDSIILKKLRAELANLLEEEANQKKELEIKMKSLPTVILNRQKKITANLRLSNGSLSRDSGSLHTSINVFDKNQLTKLCFSYLNSDINIENINRQFMIKFVGVEFMKSFKDKLDLTNYNNIVEIKSILMCGAEKLSRKRKFILKFHNHASNFNFHKKIYFDIPYSDLPMVSSILFKIKHIAISKRENNKIFEKTVAWVNFKLFDHLKRLKTGPHKVYLSSNIFSDFSYFNWSQNFSPNCHKIYFELESFMRPVLGKIQEKKTKLKMDSFKFEIKDQIKITEILERSPFDVLSSYDKRTIWNNRYALTQIQSAIPFIFQCADMKNKDYNSEIDKIVSLCQPLPAIKAMQLLTGKFLDEEIRNYAVRSLESVGSHNVEDYMIQLIQSLKYEMNHDSALARYLLNIAIKNPLTIGHSFFWNLKSEIYNPDYQQRFGLYLEVFLNKIGVLRNVFESEIWLVNQFLEICDLPHDKGLSKEEIMYRFRTGLKYIDKKLNNYSYLSLPIDFKIQVKSLVIDECKIMKSKKKPIRFVFKNKDERGDDIIVMFKKGDDLRQDILTLQLFKSMQNLWFDEGLKLKMSLYKVISTGYFQGMCQFVTKSETLATIHKIAGGVTTPLFSNKSITDWLERFSNVPKNDWVENFLVSCAAYCVSTFVLGIGDRHNDNIMIKMNGELFHIDFGHFLGHFKYKYGIKRERAPFVFTPEFLNVLGGPKDDNYALFKDICYDAYRILRKNSEVLITLLQMMICTGIPELNTKSIRTLESSLCLNYDNIRAKDYLFENLEKSLNSMSTRINFAIHIMANK